LYALSTVAFFMSGIGVFILGYAASQALSLRDTRSRSKWPIWQRVVAILRYLSYRGFHVKQLSWNSAPLGVLMLGGIGAIYFFCVSNSHCDIVDTLY
jgi:hypothetical protein